MNVLRHHFMSMSISTIAPLSSWFFFSARNTTTKQKTIGIGFPSLTPTWRSLWRSCNYATSTPRYRFDASHQEPPTLPPTPSPHPFKPRPPPHPTPRPFPPARPWLESTGQSQLGNRFHIVDQTKNQPGKRIHNLHFHSTWCWIRYCS